MTEKIITIRLKELGSRESLSQYMKEIATSISLGDTAGFYVKEGIYWEIKDQPFTIVMNKDNVLEGEDDE